MKIKIGVFFCSFTHCTKIVVNQLSTKEMYRVKSILNHIAYNTMHKKKMIINIMIIFTEYVPLGSHHVR